MIATVDFIMENAHGMNVGAWSSYSAYSTFLLVLLSPKIRGISRMVKSAPNYTEHLLANPGMDSLLIQGTNRVWLLIDLTPQTSYHFINFALVVYLK